MLYLLLLKNYRYPNKSAIFLPTNFSEEPNKGIGHGNLQMVFTKDM
jgi:hypothetical protein